MLFFLIALAAVFIVGWLRGLHPIALFKHFRENEGSLAGVAIVLTLVLVVGLLGGCSAGQWFQYAEMRAGLDYTDEKNGVCRKGGVDDRVSSDIAVMAHIWTYDNVTVEGGRKHNSCAYGEDEDTQDMWGLDLTYRFWTR